MEDLINLLENKIETPKEDLSNLHFHNGYQFIFVTEGQVKIEIDSRTHEAHAPAVILLNPFERHKIHAQGEKYARTVLSLNAESLEKNVSLHLISRLKCRPIGFRHILVPDKNCFEQMCNYLVLIKEESENKDLFYETLILNAVYNLLILVCRLQEVNVQYSKNMMQVQSYIDKNYARIESIRQLAEQHYISPGHLSRSFKSFTGYSPDEYLQNTRLYHAVRILTCSDLSVKEICHLVGYRDINNFTRQFKKRFGTSPTQLRRNSRNL